MRKNIFLRLSALLACLALLLSGCDSLQLPQKNKNTPAATEAPAFVEDKDLHLYLKESVFFLGEQAQFEMTVLAGEALTGDIVVQNQDGKIIAAIKNDGSGVLHATARVDTSAIISGSLTAAAGSVTSRSVLYNVQPEVTPAMMSTLMDTAEDVAGVAGNAGIEDLYSEEAFTAVQAYLEKDPRVRQVRRGTDGMYYLTQDGLLGFYGETQSADFAGAPISFEEPVDVFESWLNEEDVSGSFLESMTPITNDRVLFMTPEYSIDLTMRNHTKMSGFLFDNAWKAAGGPGIEYINDMAATQMLLDGNYNDYGFVMLGAHGSYVEGSSGSDLLFIRAAYGTREEMEALLAESNESLSNYWLDDLEHLDKARASLSTIQTGGEQPQTHHVLRFSGRLLEAGLSDRIFDNTVLYMFVCYGFRDEQLIQAYLDHGVSIVIGCTGTMTSGYSSMAFYELAESIRTTPKGEKCITIPEAILKMDSDTIRQIMKEYYQCSDKDFKKNKQVIELEKDFNEAYERALDEKRYITYKARNVNMVSRVLYGYADAKGSVFQEMKDGTKTGIAGADITLYRWLNHNFEEYEEARTTTDADGNYKFEDVPCGIYGVLAEKDGFRTWTACEIGEDATEIDPIRLLVELSGVVLDEQTGLPIDGALVTLNSRTAKHPVSKTALTNAEGKWSMIVSPAPYTVLFNQPGYMQKNSVVQRQWLAQGPYWFEVQLRPMHGLVITTQPEEKYEELHTQLILRPQVLRGPVDEARILSPLENVFSEAKSVDMGDALQSYVIAVPDHIYANENIVSMQLYWHFVNQGAHGLQGTESILLDAETGEKLTLRDLLDKNSPDAESRLRKWLKEDFAYPEEALFTTVDELIDSIVKEHCGTWCLTREGLQLSLDPAEVAMWVAGGSYQTLLYSKMSGIIDPKYMPGAIVGDGTATVEKLPEGDLRSETHTIWGSGVHPLVIDGQVANFEVRWLSDTKIARGVAFYAELLDDAIVFLPDVSNPVFEVRWESGGKHFATKFDFN